MITKLFLFLSVIFLASCASTRYTHRTLAEEPQRQETQKEFINDWR